MENYGAYSYAGGGISSGISSITNAYLAYQQGKIRKKWYETNKYIAEINAKIANLEAENIKLTTDLQEKLTEQQVRDSLKRGDIAVSISKQRTKKVIGSQRAALAAQGIRIDEGSARDVQLETAEIGELDAMNIRNNAAREAFGYKTQSISQRMRGESQMFAKMIEASKYQMRAIDYGYRGKMAEITGQTEAGQTLLTGALKSYDYYSGSRKTGRGRSGGNNIGAGGAEQSSERYYGNYSDEPWWGRD